MKRTKHVIAVAVSVLFFAGCASIQSGTTQTVKISSNPEGATVYVAEIKDNSILNKVAVGVTPLSASIARKDGAIVLEKEGYESTSVDLKKELNPWFWGNVLLGSLLSSFIDTSTGAMHEYDPGEYMVDLKPLSK